MRKAIIRTYFRLKKGGPFDRSGSSDRLINAQANLPEGYIREASEEGGVKEKKKKR